ncbi:MAG TPA: amidohydrolase family protein [Paraburkholderia sp.]|nr:amidohydrolase family protein [Paraburkholderia sp.]
MNGIVFNNVRVFDGHPIAPFPAQVRVEANRITHVVRHGEPLATRPDDQLYECSGATLMPGLVDAQARLSWPSSVEKIVPYMTLPPEELAFTAARNARILLDHGYTSAYSAGSLNARVERCLADHIESGGLPGPRIVPSSLEHMPFPAMHEAGFKHQDEEPCGSTTEVVRAFVRASAAMGARSVKFVLSAEDSLSFGASQPTLCTEAETRAAAEEAYRTGVWLAARAQTPSAIKLAVRYGFRVLYHCANADEEALDLLEAARQRIFIVPAIGIVEAALDAYRLTHRAMNGVSGSTVSASTAHVLHRQAVPQMRARSVRVLPGRDHGLPFCPHGHHARALERFVQLLGYTPLETLSAATVLGGQLMGFEGELGRIHPGYLADLLLVKGNPAQEIALLQDKSNLLAIMKDGRFHKAPAEQC